jgi:hypothetical protein
LQINAYHFQPLTGNNSMQKLRKYKKNQKLG